MSNISEEGYHGFVCPECGSEIQRVTDVRSHMGEYMRRRRECSCGHRITTYEITANEYNKYKETLNVRA